MNANLEKKVIEMTKKEAKEAGILNSEKFKELQTYLAVYPGYTVEIKAPAKRKAEFKGLTYAYMRAYILKHDDEQKTIMADIPNLLSNEYALNSSTEKQ